MKPKKTVDEKLSESLDTTFESKSEEVTKGRKVTEIQVNAVDSEKDYWLVRKNMKELISTGEDAIEGILKVAMEGDSPRAYEVAAQMIKTVAEANKDLLDLHKKMKDIRKDDSGPSSVSQTNAIYVGSTKDLQELVNQSRSAARRLNSSDDIIDVEIENGEDG